MAVDNHMMAAFVRQTRQDCASVISFGTNDDCDCLCGARSHAVCVCVCVRACVCARPKATLFDNIHRLPHTLLSSPSPLIKE